MMRSSTSTATPIGSQIRPEDIELKDTTQLDVTWALQQTNTVTR